MKKFVSALCATALTAALAVTTVVPANAAPAYVPNIQPQDAQHSDSDVVQVRDDWRWKKRRGNTPGWGGPGWNGVPNNWENPRRSHRRDNWSNGPRYGWHNGHRGYRYQRPGYRYYDGWWFPAGAFVAGAIIGGAIANSNNGPVYNSGGNAHVQWCYNRYRSYRAYDNTFQPYNGPRQQCYSPYS